MTGGNAGNDMRAGLDDPTGVERLPIAQAWYMRTWRGFRMETPQVHDRLEIMYVLSGTCTMGVGREPCDPASAPEGSLPEPDIAERRLMRRGDFLFVNANVPHTLVTDPEGDCRMLNIEYSWRPVSGAGLSSGMEMRTAEVGGYTGFPCVDMQAAGTPELAEWLRRKPAHLFLKDTQDVGSLLKSLVLEMDGGAAPAEWFVQGLFFALHVRISRLLAESERFSLDAAQRYVADALQYMRTHYDRELRIAEVASIVNVHPAHLQRLFHRSQGCTMVEWLNRYRMEQAKMLLLTTELPVADLCGYVGMNSRQHFSAVFREFVGTSPADYRRQASRTRYADAGGLRG